MIEITDGWDLLTLLLRNINLWLNQVWSAQCREILFLDFLAAVLAKAGSVTVDPLVPLLRDTLK